MQLTRSLFHRTFIAAGSALATTATLLAIGAGAEVAEVSELAPPPGASPKILWVQPFVTSEATIQTDKGGPLQRLRNGGSPGPVRSEVKDIVGTILGHQDSMVGDSADTVASKAAAMLQSELIKALNDRGISAQTWTPAASGDAGAIVLSGQFVTIDEGSQVRRMAIGLGAGQSYLATQVQLFPADGHPPSPFLAFHTEGDSGISPGVLVGGAIGSAVTSAAVGAGISGVHSSRKGTPSDLESTAESIAKYLETYWKEQGWLKGEDEDSEPKPSAEGE